MRVIYLYQITIFYNIKIPFKCKQTILSNLTMNEYVVNPCCKKIMDIINFINADSIHLRGFKMYYRVTQSMKNKRNCKNIDNQTNVGNKRKS